MHVGRKLAMDGLSETCWITLSCMVEPHSDTSNGTLGKEEACLLTAGPFRDTIELKKREKSESDSVPGEQHKKLNQRLSAENESM